MEMKFKLFALFALFALLLPSVALADNIYHCFYVTGGTTITPQTTWSGCYAPLSDSVMINGAHYSTMVLLGSTLSASNFGNYNIRCDDGVSQAEKNYAKLLLDTSVRTAFNSSKSDGTAQGNGEHYCLGTPPNNVTGKSSEGIGFGDMASISMPFDAANTSIIGPHTYDVQVATHPVANTNGTGWVSRTSGSFFVSAYPSLMVFGPADENFGFNEQFGNYNRELFFTLYNKFPLDITISSYHINCSPGVTCSVDPRYAGFKVSPDEVMIIDANFSLNKHTLPSSFSVSLDVNFNVPAFSGNSCFKTYSTYSKPAVFNVGLMDQQDFQVEMKASEDQNFCIGENGMIGQTGEYYAPRVNVGFGGATTNSSDLISIDECDPKTPTDTGYVDNNDWVYCSQKEFLVELGEKVGKIGQIREQINQARSDTDAARGLARVNELLAEETYYSNFSAYIKTQNLTSASITSSLSKIDALLFNNSLGLNNYFTSPSGSTLDNITQLAMLQSMYGSTTFLGNTALTAGLYTGHIDVNELALPSTSSYLFNSGNVLNSNIKINVTLNSQPTTYFDWMFYQQGDSELAESSVSDSGITPGNYAISNDSKRGTVLELEYNSKTGVADSNVLYNTFGVPFFVRVADVNGNIDRNFTVEARTQTPPTLFSYWTGFASSLGLGTGCETIANAANNTLEYRSPDKKVGTATNPLTFEFTDFNSTKKDSVEYLETVVFLPSSSSGPAVDGVEFSSPFNAYTKNFACIGSPSGRCTFDINSSMTSYKLSNTTTLTSIINGIKDRNLCVYKGINARGNTQWTVFWNQQKILSELNAKKTAITDANICATREILGG